MNCDHNCMACAIESCDKPHEECGVFGIFAPGLDVATLTYYGLYALQHRGQESAGIAVSDGQQVRLQKGMGLVAEVFNTANLTCLTGHIACGHNRYSTTGSSHVTNAQPILFRYTKGTLCVAHNGNLVNAEALEQQLGMSGAVFQTTVDSEVIGCLIAKHSQGTLEEAMMKTMIDLKGSYSLVVMTEDKLVAVRDPHGLRPLCIGKLEGGWVVASESCALDIVGATLVRDVEPGEIITIDEDGLHSIQHMQGRRAQCIFEYIYFARPDSTLDGVNVNMARREMGRQLALEAHVDADIVVPVPESGTSAALGYAQQSGLPFTQGLMRNRYAGRTFIQPSQELRALGVKLKLNPVRPLVEGKRVVMVEDSIIRGTTSVPVVKMLREAGAKEVHMAISAPPWKYSCYYGVDTSATEELIANRMSVEEICRYIGADSLTYLSHEGLLKAVNGRVDQYCLACFDGNYPVSTGMKAARKHVLEKC